MKVILTGIFLLLGLLLTSVGTSAFAEADKTDTKKHAKEEDKHGKDGQGKKDHAHDKKGHGAHDDHGHHPSYVEVIFPFTADPKDTKEPFQGFDALMLFLWTLGVFLLLLFIMNKFAWGPMLEGLRKREAAILSAEEEARKAKEASEALRSQYEAEREARAQEISQMMEKARQEAEALRTELRNKANEEIEAERNSLRAEIQQSRDRAMQEIWDQTAQIAAAISAKSMRRSLTDADQQQLAAVATERVSTFKAGLAQQSGDSQEAIS